MRELLSKNRARVLDLFLDLDLDGSGTISVVEMSEGLKKLGFDTSYDDVKALCDSIDQASSYSEPHP